MIEWNNYVDKIWCINYMPYKKRHELMQHELDRVGITNANFEWNLTYSSTWHDYLFQKTKTDKKCGCQNVNELKCTFAHYDCVKRSLINGYNRILILEDDERFLKDLNCIDKILSNIPANMDVILLDYSNIHKEEIDKYRSMKINDYFSEFTLLNNTGCYILTRKAIEVFVQLYESLILPADSYFHKFDYKKLNLNKCFSVKHVSCQATFKNSMSFNSLGINTVHNVYKAAGLNYDEYMMRFDGSKYEYGDFINEDN